MITPDRCKKFGTIYAEYIGPDGIVKTGDFKGHWEHGKPICIDSKDILNSLFRVRLPGSILKALFRKIGAPSCQLCNGTAKEMDMHGPQWCQDNFNGLVLEIFENAKNHDWLGLLVRTAAVFKSDEMKWKIAEQLNEAIDQSI